MSSKSTKKDTMVTLPGFNEMPEDQKAETKRLLQVVYDQKDYDLIRCGKNVSNMLDDSSNARNPTPKVSSKSPAPRVVITDKIHVLMPTKTVTDTNLLNWIYKLSFTLIKTSIRENVISGTISLISSMFPEINEDKELISSLEIMGIQIIYITISSFPDLLQKVRMQKDLRKIIESMSEEKVEKSMKTKMRIPEIDEIDLGLIQISVHFYNVYAITGTLLAMMGKTLTEVNAEAWRERRWKAYCSSLGLEHGKKLIFRDMAIPLINWQMIGHFFGYAQPFRRTLAQYLISQGSSEGPIGIVSQNTLKYLKWAEMTHIGLINQYILKMHPFLIHLKELVPFMKDFCACLKQMQEVEKVPELWCYIKILGKKNDMEYLNRKRFGLLTAIATEIGKNYNTTLTSYNGVNALTQEEIRIRDLVISLVITRTTSQSSSDQGVEDTSGITSAMGRMTSRIPAVDSTEELD